MAKIVGVVEDRNNAPLEGVLLDFVGANDKDTVKTDSKGSFETKILKPGDYDWTAMKDGFASKKGKVPGLQEGDANFSVEAIILENPEKAKDDFDKLTELVKQPDFALIPPVSIDEAIEFMKLYRVSNYAMVNLIGCIENLDSALKSGPEIVEKEKKLAFLEKYSGTIDSILGERTVQGQPSKVETEVMVAMRQQFDIGTASATNVNTEFKTIFKRLVGLCNDDLLAVDPEKTARESPISFGPKEKEESYKFLRNLKKEIINLTQNMSYFGTLGTKPLIKKMAAIQYESLDLINRFGKIYLSPDDEDSRHFKSIITKMNGVQANDIEPYLVHAKEGGMLLDYVIKVYAEIKRSNGVEDDSDDYLEDLFFIKKIFPDDTDNVSEKVSDKKVKDALRENAGMIMQYWPKNWG